MSTAVIVERPSSLFEIPGCTFTEIALDIKPGMKFEHWERLIRALERAEQGIQWYLGDALNYGEREYGEKYAQVLDAHKRTGIPIDTLRNYQWVAERVKPVTRVTELDWSVHREVATLSEDKQKEVLSRGIEQKKTGQKFTRRQAEKEARRVKKEGQLKPNEEDFIHPQAVRAWIDEFIEKLKSDDDLVPVPFLHNMIQADIGQAQWQRDRTIQSDCLAILEMFAGDEGVYTGSDADIFKWLIRSGYFMSDPDLDDRLELMVERKLLKRVRQGGKKETQRGDMVDLYMLPAQLTGEVGTVRRGQSIYEMGERE